MTALRVIHIEDSDDDAELLRMQLRRAGFDVEIARVQSANEMAAALQSGAWDAVIADHSVPGFEAPHALELLQSHQLDLPFIILSGTVSHEIAVAMMRAGAHDFVSKDLPERLEPILRRELRQAEHRRHQRHVEHERQVLFEERADILARLESANRAKDEFLAMLGHELRNPLAPIVTALQLMKSRGQAPSREQLVIERQVAHLNRLVDDLLDVAKIARGKVDLEAETLDIADVVASAVEMASPLLEARRHHFRVAAPAGQHFVHGDEARLVQVLANLLTNAARYTLPGGEISLTARSDADQVVITVQDNGTGIDAATLPTIFDLFVQGRRALNRSGGGLGLGLALVRNLVELHGGTVSGESEGDGRGSLFTVRLPSLPPVAAKTHADTSAERRAPAVDPARPRVLLVDDNEDSVEMIAAAMRLDGHEVAVAHDGPSALALFAEVTTDVVVLDIGLPVMDGYELAREIRARAGARPLRLIALTGYGQACDRERSSQAGFDVHLVKPVDLQKLLDAIALPTSSNATSEA